MSVSLEHQSLIDFFAQQSLPTGPQHVNPYSVFLNLSVAVTNRLANLHSKTDSTRQSAALMLQEVKEWLLNQDGESAQPLGRQILF